MKPTPAVLAKLALFVVGAYFSFEHCASYWYVGLIFGVVVIAWNAQSVGDLVTPRTAAFLTASALIYALVYFLASKLEAERKFEIAVAVGTILLPIAHQLFLGAPAQRVRIAIPFLYGLWFAFNLLFERLHLEGIAGKFFNSVSAWQALYLLALIPVPKRGR